MQESSNLLEKMINLNLIDSNFTKRISTKYFEHYQTKVETKSKISSDPFCKVFLKNYEESKKDWELHKRLVSEGANPSCIAKAIRRNNIEEPQEISSQKTLILIK